MIRTSDPSGATALVAIGTCIVVKFVTIRPSTDQIRFAVCRGRLFVSWLVRSEAADARGAGRLAPDGRGQAAVGQSATQPGEHLVGRCYRAVDVRVGVGVGDEV